MEGPNSLDGNFMRFEDFVESVEQDFLKNGLTNELNEKIERWVKLRSEGCDAYGASAGDRINFQLELAQLLGATDQRDKSWQVLSDAWDYANGMGYFVSRELLKKVEYWMDIIHGKNE